MLIAYTHSCTLVYAYMYKILLDCLPDLDHPPIIRDSGTPCLLRIRLYKISRARPLAYAYSAVHLPPLHHASLRHRHRLASIVSLTPPVIMYVCIKIYLIACLIWTILPSFGILALLVMR